VRTVSQDPSQLLELPICRKVAAHDEMFESDDQYFGAGLSALWAIQNIVRCRSAVVRDADFPREILDFGCGCGRVARFLAAAFPSARIHVTDLRADDVQWCAENLGCHPFSASLPDPRFELIWVGSVFTHLPAHSAREVLDRLVHSLVPDGILAFSTQGRLAHHWLETREQSWMSYGLALPLVRQVLDQWQTCGYGYADYSGQSGYGVCIAKPEWYTATMRQLADVTQIFFQERAYDDHQDIFAFMRRPIGDSQTQMFDTLGRELRDDPASVK
jgi:SAM-dependent methyltransferase